MEKIKYKTDSKLSVTFKKNDLIFCCLYFVTLLTLLLDQLDTAVLTSVLRKVKYVYIAIMACYFFASVFSSKRGQFKCTTAALVIAILLLHTVLFGYIFTNDIVIEETHEHALQLLIFYAFGYLTYYYIDQNHCFKLFIACSYIACVLTLIYAFFTHIGEGLNIVWGIRNMFSGGSGRYRATYGFTHGAYLAYHCFITLSLSLFLLGDVKLIKNKSYRQITTILCYCCDLFTVVLLVMSAERSGFLTTVVVFALYFVISFLREKKVKFTKKFLIWTVVLVGIVLVILGVSGALSYIWENSSRELNISVNYSVFQQLGNFWTGMGYVENSGFQSAASVFGIKTSSLDMYYVYIFFTTGFVGIVLIGSAILIIFLNLFFNTNKKYGEETLALFCGMLFFAIWNVSLFSYRHQPEIILFVILLCVTGTNKSNKKTKIKDICCNKLY